MLSSKSSEPRITGAPGKDNVASALDSKASWCAKGVARRTLAKRSARVVAQAIPARRRISAV